jgi:hypothetical protein
VHGLAYHFEKTNRHLACLSDHVLTASIPPICAWAMWTDAQTIYRVIISQHHHQVFGDQLLRTRSQVPTWHQSRRHVPIDYIRAARRHSQKGMYQQTLMPGVHVRFSRRSCLPNDKHLKIISGSTRPSQRGQLSSNMSCNLRGDSARQAPAA